MVERRRVIEETLAGAPDWWAESARGVRGGESLDGMLPVSRALPACAVAEELASEGREACDALLEIAGQEGAGDRVFGNAVFALLYFDSLFAYRSLKVLYEGASAERRKRVDVACRKMILRCVEVPEGEQAALRREIVRNTYGGRLATTGMVADLAVRL